ncbi:MAG TPA: DNA-processing protein DprA [Polyangiaceae bacterium]|nr:DNA-processing protein DprA [Polyangiaceae bacterium]
MVDACSRVLTGPLLPVRLLDLPRPPRRIHVLGELPRGPGVAIVGSRHPTKEAHCFAFRLARDLARAGITVLSGGAAGIDGAAHLGALRGGGATVVVAPAGFEKPFPAFHRRLFERVLERGGAYLSLRRPAEPAFGFFARNACLVALAHVLVVVEAKYRSGARNAASWARRLGRPLLIVPSAPWIPAGRGCLLELRLGGKLCTGPEDVLDALEQSLVLPPRPKQRTSDEAEQTELPFTAPTPATALDAQARLLLEAVRAGARHLDAVCERSGLSAAAAQRLILTLTLEGVLAADPAGGLGVAPAGKSVSRRKPLK